MEQEQVLDELGASRGLDLGHLHGNLQQAIAIRCVLEELVSQLTPQLDELAVRCSSIRKVPSIRFVEPSLLLNLERELRRTIGRSTVPLD